MTGTERAARAREKRRAARPPKVLPPCPDFFRSSLTDHIARDGFVRRYIDEHFPSLKDIARERSRQLRERGFVEQPSPLEPRFVSIAGIAVDYRIRVYFKPGVERSGIVQRGLRMLKGPSHVGSSALNDGPPKVWQPNIWHTHGYAIAGRLLASYRRFVATHRPEKKPPSAEREETLCRYCVLFALLDSIGRAPLSSALGYMITLGSLDVSKMLAGVDDALVAEVVKLSGAFHRQHRKMIAQSRRVVIGSTLAGSADIGNADFDLLIDGCLIDVKVIRNPGITTTHLRQLVGYWLLDYEDRLKIRKVAIYLARPGHLELFDVKRELLRAQASAPDVRKAFRKQLRKLGRSAKRGTSD